MVLYGRLYRERIRVAIQKREEHLDNLDLRLDGEVDGSCFEGTGEGSDSGGVGEEYNPSLNLRPNYQ